MKSGLKSIALLVGLAAGTAAQADRLDERWQTQREFYMELSDTACAGNENDHDFLFNAAVQERNPVAMNSLAWLIRPGTDCVGVAHDRETWLELLQTSAERGYPVGMSNWGHVLVTGDYGPRDLESGLLYLEEAMEQGNAKSAEILALIYGEGRHGVAQDLSTARMFLQRAGMLGMDEGQLTLLADRLNRQED
ncbi:hypothetical protein P1J78_19445 [Psychromarinibacter sp. C21-152]|uniref:Sel1 repeat-containing protein n=1 Tax=Psychromarinibacter sediminicola TaxID=3033385 RepID=A0AAE3NSW0_9RHOB|nr:hypothetical protein [Psychromarinibacter sediminicola]MDF0602923.1 hypothetical protein [Psychromarinibacter sediminicola]